MSVYKINLQQRVFYQVHVEAASPVEALRLVQRALVDPAPDAPDLEDFGLQEVDSQEFEFEATQTDDAGHEYDDPEFVAELERIAPP